MRRFRCLRPAAVTFVVAAVVVGSLPATAADGEWARQFGASGLDEAKAVAVDPAGDAYGVGETFGALPVRHRRARSTRSSASTTPLASRCGRQFGGAGSGIGAGVAVDADGNVSVVGTTSSALPGQVSAGSFDAFVRRYDPAGREVWTRQFGTSGGDNARGVAVDRWGRLVVVGSTEGALPGQVPAGGFDAFVSLFDADGHQLWTRQFGSRGDDFGVAVATHPNGDIPVAGSADEAFPGQASAGGTTAFLRHFDVAGTALWTQQFGTGLTDDAWDVAVDAEGSAYLVGTTERVLPRQRSAGRIDAFVQKYDPGGREVWTHQFGTPEDDDALAVAVDRQDGIVIAGSTRGRLGDRWAGDLDADTMRLAASRPN